MARYIDADKYVEYLEKEICSKCIDEVCGACGLDSARWIAEEIPTADVVPRAEVAREIFEEIEQEILSAIDNNLQRMAEQEEANEIWRMCVSKKNTLCGIYDFIAELKKKYIGE